MTLNDTGLRFLERHHAGWNRAWEAIKDTFGDYDCECPEWGERWQYMGSCYGRHEFRHRCLHPRRERKYFNVPELPSDWTTEGEES